MRRMARWLVLVPALTALVVAGAGGSQPTQTLPISPLSKVESQKRDRGAIFQAAKLAELRSTIVEYRLKTWQCQDKLGMKRSNASHTAWALPRSMLYRQWTVALWKQRSVACGVVLEQRSLPNTNDWQTAVRIAQRAYPGTSDWMLSISDREGGWGPWVWYGGRGWSGYHVGDDFLGADTVGGWMQFRFSTFDPYWRMAREDLRRRGFIVPDFRMPAEGGPTKYAAWLSPLGQALTAGYMRYTGKDGCHWCL